MSNTHLMKRGCKMNSKELYLCKQQENNPYYKNVRAVFFELAKIKGFVLEPTILGELFYKHLEKQNHSDKNLQTARNMSKVFSILNHYKYLNGKRKNDNSFSISPMVWKLHCIGKDALEKSIKLLKEMNLIDYFNSCYQGNKERRKRFYQINLYALQNLLTNYQRELEKEQAKQTSKDLFLYEHFLNYTNHKEYNTELAEEQAFSKFKENVNKGKIILPQQKEYTFKESLDNLEEII